jgi:hypothetical protein
MERYRSSTTDLPHVRNERWSDRDLDECGGRISVDAGPASAMVPGPSPRDGGGVKTSGKNSADRVVFRSSDPVQELLQAIRRKLWILNASLESLCAKIEPAYRKRYEAAGRDGPDQHRHSPAESGDERMALKAWGAVGGWRARRKLARLRSRADRAERRAAVAINGASASFGVALEAMLQAAIARLKADEACLGPCRPPTSRRCD